MSDLELAFANYEDMIRRQACGDRSEQAVAKARAKLIATLSRPATQAPEARNEWKVAVIDALAAWPGMDFSHDTPPRTIIEAILKMERAAAVELSPTTQAGALQAVGARVHEEGATSVHATLYAPVLKEFCLEASREDEGRNWYIEVTDESGYHTYDGYWRDSERRTCAEVLAEAADGSLLHEITPLPADAIPLAATQPNAAPAAEVVAWIDPVADEAVTASRLAKWPAHNRARYTVPALAAPGAAIDAREQEDPEAFLDTGLADVQDESGINTYYSRNAVLECIAAALASRSEAPEARPNAAGQEHAG